MTLYGVAEIAARLGMNQATVSQWLRRGKLPEPDARLAMGPVWTGKTLEPWFRKQG